MKCSRCGNSIKTIFHCNICVQKFCSEDCLMSHSSLDHQSNISYSVTNQSLNNNTPLFINKQNYNLKSIISPYLVKGTYNNSELKYDQFFSLENFNLIFSNGEPELIGKGSFGQVYLAENKLNKRKYAIKHMEKDDVIKYLNDLEQVYNEIDIQSRCNHPNIIKLYYVKETKKSFDLILEYAKYGTLFDLVVSQKGLPEKLAFKFFIQVVNAIKFLHDNNIIHRDIKPENILLFDNNVVKLCDFGLSAKCESTLPGGSFSGTTEYMSPELINNEDYGKEVDLWMLGILLYELIHSISPFRPKKQEFEEKELIENIQNNNILFYMPCSEEFKELVYWLLEPDIKKRCKIDEIYNSKFVKKYENEKYEKHDNHHKDNDSVEEYENYDNDSIYVVNDVKKSIDNNSGNNIIKIKKNLLNRYENIEEFNNSRRKDNNIELIGENLEIEFTKARRKKSEKITNSKFNKLNLMENDDLIESEFNVPKNNKRNKIKKKPLKNLNNGQLNIDIKNSLKNEIYNENFLLTDSPKKTDKVQNENKIEKINLILPKKELKNNIRNPKNNEVQKKKLTEKNNENRNIQITNYIFNNKENKETKENNQKNKHFIENKTIEINHKLLSNNLSNNQKNQILSLSLVPGTVDYNSLLNHSSSTEKQIFSIFEKNKKIQFDNLNNCLLKEPINENQKLSNDISQKIKDYPFDHFIWNSSLDIHFQKTIFNNKMIKRNNQKFIKNQEEKYNDIKMKEPNDNMRRRNKKIKKDVPLDNIKKENKEIENKENKEDKKNKETEELKPSDNHKKTINLDDTTKSLKSNNSINNEKNKNMNINALNTIYDEKEKINTINKENPFSESLTKKIAENIKEISKEQNYIKDSGRNTNNFLPQKRKKSEEINKNNVFKSSKGKNKIGQNKNLKLINNEEKENKNTINKKILFSNRPLITENREIKVQNILLNQKKFKNNSFVIKNSEIRKFLGNKVANNAKESNKKESYNNIYVKNDKKTKSVNKKRDFKFNKDNKDLKPIKSSKDIVKNKNKLGKIKQIKKVNANIIKSNDMKEKNEKKKITKIEFIEKIKIAKEKLNPKNISHNNKKHINTEKKEDKINILKISEKNDDKNENTLKSINKEEEEEIQKKNFEKESEINSNKNNNKNYGIILVDEKKIDNIEYNQEIIDNNKNKLNLKDYDDDEKSKEKINQVNNENIIENKKQENILEENKENLNNYENKDIIIEKEIIQNKFDNFQIKEIYRTKENNSSKNNYPKIKLKFENKQEGELDKNIFEDNLKNNIKIIQGINKKEKSFKTSLSMYERNIINENYFKSINISNIKIDNKKLKLCLENIIENLDKNSSKENKTSRLDKSIKKSKKNKKLNLKLSVINKKNINKISPSFFPKKIGSDLNSSNSSIYEYDKPQIEEDTDIISNNKEKKKSLSISNSESKITNCSKNYRQNIKELNAFYDMNCEKNNIINFKSKSPNNDYRINYQNNEKKKGFQLNAKDKINGNNKKTNKSNKKEFSNFGKLSKMQKNKTEVSLLKRKKRDKLININEINNENVEKYKFSKKVNSEKYIKKLKETNINKNENIKSLKKKYKKSLTESSKDIIEKNEKGNESESFIIEGDSEYGDSEAFKL